MWTRLTQPDGVLQYIDAASVLRIEIDQSDKTAAVELPTDTLSVTVESAEALFELLHMSEIQPAKATSPAP